MMNGEATISLAFLISVVAIVCTIAGLVINIRKSRKDEAIEREKAIQAQQNQRLEMEKNFVKVNIKLDNFCNDVNQLLKTQEKYGEELRAVSQNIVMSTAKIERLFQYKDDHEKRLEALERKGLND